MAALISNLTQISPRNRAGTRSPTMSAGKASAKRPPEFDNLKPKRQRRVIAEDNSDSAISRQNFDKGLSKSSKECVNFQEVFEKFFKERFELLDVTLKGIITKYEEKEMLLDCRYEQLRKKEKLAYSAKRAQVQESVTTKKQQFIGNLCAKYGGTVNIVAQVEGKTLVAVDSRASGRHTDIDTNEQYTLWNNDVSIKLKEVAPGVIITACGDKRRNMDLWDFLEDKAPKDIDEASMYVKSFLGKREANEGLCELFLVGYCPLAKVPVIYHARDEKDKPPFVRPYFMEDGEIYICGSGSEGAKLALNYRPNMNQEETKSCICRGFIGACIHCPCCGGWLLTAEIWNKTVIPGNPTFVLDLMMTPSFFDFLPTHLLVFSCHNHTVMNYKVLKLHFEKDFLHAIVHDPSCMGYINSQWTCFLVNMVGVNSLNLADQYFEFYCVKSYADLRFRTATVKKTGTQVVVMRGNAENIQYARSKLL